MKRDFFKFNGYRLLLVFAVLFTSGCRNKDSTPLTILTDSPMLYMALELYRGEPGHPYFIIEYYDDAIQIYQQERRGDLLISHFLNAPSLMSSLKDIPTESYRKNIFIDELNKNSESVSIIPLALYPTLIVFNPVNLPSSPSNAFTIEDNEIMNLASGFLEQTREELTRVGFSPFWELLILDDFLISSNVNFTSGDDGMGWNAKGLEAFTTLLREWHNTVGIDADAAFRQKYFNVPAVRLLAEGRILFYRMELNNFLLLPEDQQNSVDFRLLEDDGEMILNRVLYGAIPQKSRDKKWAQSILLWLSSPDNQQRIIDEQRRKQFGITGFLGGLSTNPSINEEHLPQYHEVLNGRIPRMPYRTLLETPENWRSFLNETLLPWIKEYLNGSATKLEEYLE